MMRIWKILSVLLLSTVLAGCAGIPMSGPVNQGSAVIEANNADIQFLPSGPSQDATQEQILRGFIEAASSPASDFAIARQFLTPDFAPQWDATAVVQVDSGLRSIQEVDAQISSLSFTLSATVDALGRYSDVTPERTVSYSYSFTQVDGQWRISSAPNGVILDRFTFDLVYAQYPLYFFDSSYTVLVPDVRFFPTGSLASTRIMKALLAGPSEWLAANGAVQTAFPPGTALVADSVPVTRGVASVDLNENALAADTTGIRRMKLQATASLQTVENITSVQLLIQGAEQEVGRADSVESLMPRPVDSRALVLTPDTFGYLTGAVIEPVTYLSSFIVSAQPSAVTVGPSARIAAMKTAEGVYLVRAPGGSSLIDGRANLIAPAIDNFGFVWSVPSNAPDQLRAISTDGSQTPVAGSWEEVGDISSLEISRDGARLVALVDTAEGFQLIARSITRDARNIPIAIGPSIVLGTLEGQALDLAWVDSSQVATLELDSAGVAHVTVFTLGGPSVKLAELGGVEVISLSGANTVSQIRVLSASGQIYTLRGGSQWQASGSNITALAVQQ